MSDQLDFEFPTERPRFETLAQTSANAHAIAVLRRPDAWPTGSLCLVGPPASGLTSLAWAWATAFDGQVLTPQAFEALEGEAIEAAAKGAVAIDPGEAVRDEVRLLNLLNAARQGTVRVLLTARRPPASWPVSQRDLASRLRAMPLVEIDLPDEEMVRARLRSACRRRYYDLPEEVESFLVLRLPRDYAAIEEYVKRLTNAVTEAGRGLTVPFAGDILEEVSGTRELFGDEDE